MPVFINPPPQRLRVTREDFVIPDRALVRMDEAPEAEVADVREMLMALLPGAEFSRKLDDEATVALSLGAPEAPVQGLPEAAAAQGYTLEVSPEGIRLRAATVAGWRYGVLTLAQLAGETAVVGARIQDWPVFAERGVRIPRSASDFQPKYRERLLQNLSHWRWNAVCFLEDDPVWRPRADPVRLVPAAEAPPASARLLERPGLAPAFGRQLAALHEEARTAAASGATAWWLDLGELPEAMLLDTLWYGLGFAGACAWSPERVELKAHRRSFGPFFFGTSTPALPRALEALDAAEESLSGEQAGFSRVLDREDPFRPAHVPTSLRLGERAGAATRLAGEAMGHLDEAAVAVEANPDVVQVLRATAHGLAELGGRLTGLQSARSRYASAHAAQSNARAVSQRTLATAEQLDALAAATRERCEEFARIWERERTGPVPAEAGSGLAATAEALETRATEIRKLRNRYIQTGVLKPPAEAGMALPTPPAERVIVPERRAMQSLAPWWPEGGTARMRLEVSGDAHGLTWEVLLDLRAHAGEAGTFNIRGAKLTVLDSDDNVIDSLPVQLTRRGFAFTPRAGAHAYHLYISPEDESGQTERRVRARQSREGIRVEGERIAARLNASGLLVALEPPGSMTEVPEDGEPAVPMLAFAAQTLSEGTRVRVVENGPLLVRIQAESPYGFAVRYDFDGTLPGCELSLNVPVSTVTVRWSGAGWHRASPLQPADSTGAPTPTTWGAVSREDGLTGALITPGVEAAHRVEPPVHSARSDAGLRHVVLLAGRIASPERTLTGLAAALAKPPRVSVGPVEERRVVEF